MKTRLNNMEKVLNMCRLSGTPVRQIDENTIEINKRFNRLCQLAEKLRVNIIVRNETKQIKELK